MRTGKQRNTRSKLECLCYRWVSGRANALVLNRHSAFGETAPLSAVLAQWSRDSGESREQVLFNRKGPSWLALPLAWLAAEDSTARGFGCGQLKVLFRFQRL